ncbi:MAG: glutamine--fructose-6-phosphate aminotransferase [Verrucomicrobia bacterium GWF2_51_19]|nr:MAG: glutamine--fructose-6-phosphate aminotransferase [Verrucomicrobia bacterium GWF2_51_19]
MCGIVGYVGKNAAVQVLIDGLKRLEYRGYDSAGLAILDKGVFSVLKKTGRVVNVEKLARKSKSPGTIGISHTRWATHGGVTDNNAHPHISSDGKIALVHNGVIENFLPLKHFLEGHGFTFSSETDTEVLSNLIAYHYKTLGGYNGNRVIESVRQSLMQVEGTYGIAVLCTDYPDQIIGARKSSPLILGVGQGEYILASDVTAFALRTQNVVFLRDDEIVCINRDEFSITTMEDNRVHASIETVDWAPDAVELGDYKHFMEKEIFEQPQSIENAMRGRFSQDSSTSHFGGLTLTPQELRHIDRILFCGCGSAWHSCLVAEHLIERFARIPVEVEYASEFRYRNAPLDKHTLVFIVSQSGETLDSLAALQESKRKGYPTLAITNVVGSTIARESDGGIYQRSGPEIGVASTKAFTAQLTILSMLALYLGRLRDMSYEDGIRFVEALKMLPQQVAQILNQAEYIQAIAHKYAHHRDFLFLGRQSLFPIALEGALKLKEVSYIHAEGYPAAEMKHGPIALISPECPSVFLATQKSIIKKTLSNIQEVKARGGPVIAVTTEECHFPKNLADDLIVIPHCHEALKPVLATVPLQLFAYYTSLARNCDVDKPRNLAKSVTVE